MVADSSQPATDKGLHQPPADDSAVTPQTPGVPESQMSPEDELPEYEELTPEYLEDECIRGDVMLRWALILLSVLLGWSYITETPILVSVRTGEYLFSHGVLPPRTDVFSATAEGRPWVNLGWFSDLILGGMYQVLGFAGLTLLSAITLGVSFWCLAKVSWPQQTTWWGTICGVLALVSIIPVIQPGSMTFTVLGLAALGWLLSERQTTSTASRSWLLVPLMLLWTNLDPRCWIGLLALLLWIVGERISKRADGTRLSLTPPLTALSIGVLVTPWPLRPLFQFQTMLLDAQQARAYQGLREFYPRLDFSVLQPEFWRTLDLFSISALTLAVVAGITILLNGKRLHFGWLLVWLGANALCLLSGGGLVYASVLNAVIATINGQDWCRHQFSMDYSVTLLNVLWSRAGRAITVLGLFLIAYLAVNGALTGAQGRRIGLGLDPRWHARISSLEQEVFPRTSSDRVLPTTPSQGDLLIWGGKKPFVDSRYSIYVKGGEDLLSLHRELRNSLFSAPVPPAEDKDAQKPAPAAPPIWKEILSRFEINDLLVRLWGPRPAYTPFFLVETNPDWELTALGSAGANLTRTDVESPEVKAALQKFNASNFSVQAFRPTDPPKPDDLGSTWPLPVSRYDRWLIQKLDISPASADLASHYLALLLESGRQMTHEQAAALATMAVQQGRRALLEDPNHPAGYRVIGRACRVLQNLEMQAAGLQRQRGTIDYYDTLILASAYSAAIAGQENPSDLMELFQLLMNRQYLDLALTTLERYDRAIAANPQLSLTPEMKTQLNEIRGKIKLAIESADAKVSVARAEGRPLVELSAIALQSGCPELALHLLEENLTNLSADMELQMIYASVLLQNGRLESATEQIESVALRLSSPQAAQVPPMFKAQYRAIARNIHLACNNLEKYIELTREDEKGFWESGVSAMLRMPFGSMQLPMQMALWPAMETALSVEAAIDLPDRWASLQFSIARAELERSDLEAARETFQKIQNLSPGFSFAPVVRLYLAGLTGNPIPEPTSKQTTPDWFKPFDELEPAPTPKPAADSAAKPDPAPSKPEEKKPDEKRPNESPAATPDKPSEASTSPMKESSTEAPKTEETKTE